MRVLVADKLPSAIVDRLGLLDIEVCIESSLKGDALEERLASWNPSVLVVRSTRVESRHIAAAAGLSLVVRAGAGVNTIDLDASSEGGVFVANCPGKNAVAVAELALGLILSLDRRIPDNVIDLRAGVWNKGLYTKGTGLAGRTLGILGTGKIGLELATRARAFGMEIVAWSRSLTEDRAQRLGIRRFENPQAVGQNCDILSVHMALTPQTRGLVDDSVLSGLPDDGVVINTARAEILDHDALLTALSRGVRAGLDVFPDEPSSKEGPFDSAIAKHPNVYGTHHIGASTTQAQNAVAAEVCRIIEGFNQTGTVDNCVNVRRQSSADHVLVVRHRDKVGVLAGVLDTLRRADINVQEMENTIFAGAKAASARIQVTGAVDTRLIEALCIDRHVLNVSAVPLLEST
jgi:D-3-phosphoglycerate dehydrogenase / 2-oxoglutarate reductase